MAETQLCLGLSIVVDSPLSRRAHLDQLLEAAARSGMVECRPGDEAEWWQRLEERGAAGAGGGGGWHKPATWGELRELVEGYGGWAEYDVGGVPRLVVDTTVAAAGEGELVDAVVEFVNTNGGARIGDPKNGDETRQQRMEVTHACLFHGVVSYWATGDFNALARYQGREGNYQCREGASGKR